MPNRHPDFAVLRVWESLGRGCSRRDDTGRCDFCSRNDGEESIAAIRDACESTRDPNAVVNPTFLVEVTSRSTEDYDRGEKLSHYKQVEGLRAVLIVSHRVQRVTIIERTGEGWAERDVRAGEAVALDDPGFSIAVDDVYAGLEL